MVMDVNVRPTMNGRVVGVGLGQFRFAGAGVGLLLSACLAAPALAGPEGAKVSSGTASIVTRGNATVIRASDKAIIDYTKFDIGKGERVRFIQPGARATVLNRINSSDPTRIDGSLRSNGTVFFINRSGVIFGPGARVNVGGLVAAAGNISNTDFLNGVHRFSDVEGAVVNEGVIDARFAALVGQRVANLGEMNSRGGVIAMVAGNDVILSERNGNFTVKVDAETLAGGPSGGATQRLGADEPGVLNAGSIRAGQGKAMMVAGDMYSLAIKNTGTVSAGSIALDGRGAGTVSVSGRLDASNRRGPGQGGSVTITGERIDVANARIAADGHRGGGTVNIGGDYRGQGTLRRATTVNVDKNSVISADGLRKGAGGRIIVWADDRTNFYGTATANGGKVSGDGGFIETSGKITLDVKGATIRASSPTGKAGLWLMDPVNVNIAAAPGSGAPVNSSGGTDTYTPDDTTSPAIVDVASVIAALEAGTNVTITTGLAGSPGTDAGDINVNAPIVLTNAPGGSPANPIPTLTLEAANDINVNQQIAAGVGTLPINVDLRAEGNVNVGADITTRGGTFTARGVDFVNTGVIQTFNSNVALNFSGNANVRAAIRTDGAMSNSAFIRITADTLNATGGANEGIDAALIAGSGGVVLQPFSDGASIGVHSGTGDFNVSLAELQQIQTTGPVTIGRTAGTGDVLVADDGALDLRPQGYALRLRGGATSIVNAITLNDNSFLSIAATTIQGPGTGNAVEIGGSSGGLVLRTSGRVELTTAVANLAADVSGGAISITNTGVLTIGAVDGVSGIGGAAAAGVDISTTGLLSIDQEINAGTGNVSLSSGTSIGFVGPGAILGGTVGLTANNNIFGNGSSDTRITGGTINLTATNGTVGQGATLRTSTGSGGTIVATAETGIDLINSGDLTVSLDAGTGDARLVNTGTLASGSSAWAARTFDVRSTGAMTLSQNITASGPGASSFQSDATISQSAMTTLNTGGGDLALTADDLTLDGSVNAGAGFITIVRNDAGTIGLGDATADLVLSKGELERMTTGHLIVGDGNTTAITVNNVAAADSSDIAFTSLRAFGNGADITFTGGASIFRGLSAVADDSITVGANLSANAGGLTLTANFDGVGDTDNDRINISPNVTISTLGGGNDITLNSTSVQGVGNATITAGRDLAVNSAIDAVGTLTLSAKGALALGGEVEANGLTIDSDNGVTLNDNVRSTGAGIFINADKDNSGNGVFTLVSGKSIETGGGDLNITAADIVLDGTIDAAAAGVTFARSTSGAIGVGTATGDLTVSGSEISRITAGSLTIGSQTADSITVDGLSGSDMATIETRLSLIANDVNVAGAINTGDASLTITRATSGFITVGTATGGLNITNDELARITTKNLTIGGPASGNVTVQNVALASTAGVDGVVAFNSGGTLSFGGATNQFKTLDAKANNGINVNTALTTTVGDLALDGDADNTAGTNDGVRIGSNRTLTSAGKIILRSTTGGITGLGLLNLVARSGVDVLNNLTTSGTTVINADSDLDNTGTLLVSSGRTISTSGNTLTITADDIVLDGSINTGQGALSLLRSGSGGVGVGTTANDMSLSSDEFGRIIATGFTIGGSNATSIVVSGLTNVNTNGIAGSTTLQTSDDGSIVFNTSNVFNSVTARAGAGITVNGQLSADAGDIVLNADTDGSAGANDVIRLNAGVTGPTSGNVRMASGVVLGANVTVAARNILFNRWISSDSTARSLTVNSSGNGVTTFADGAGSFNRLFTLTTNADGITRVRGDVRTTGSMQFFDNVRLTGNTTADASGGLGVLFAGRVDTADDVAPRDLTVLTRRNTNSTAKRIPLIRFGGPVGQNRALRDLHLNYDDSGSTVINGRANVPAVPTIVARQFDANGNAVANPTTAFNMSFNTTRDFRMGRNEKLAVVGSTTINAANAVIGDISSLRNLNVNAPSIAINLRQPGRVLTSVVSASNPGGLSAFQDSGVDFVSGGSITFSVTPTLLGSGANPAFASADGSDFSANLSQFVRQRFGTVTASNFNRIETVGGTAQPAITLDLVSSGSIDVPLGTVFAAAIPRDPLADRVSSEFAIDQAATDELRDIGVFARGATGDELIATLGGVGTFDDIPRRSLPTATDYTTVSNRLPASAVRRVLDAYQDTFTTLTTGADGVAVRVNRSAEIQQALFDSVNRFRSGGAGASAAPAASPRSFDPVAFRAYLESNPDESVSLGYVRQIANFLQQLELLGLTPRELTQSKAAVLGPIRPRGIPTLEQLETVIRSGSSSAVASQ